MLKYRPNLKNKARQLRKDLTDSERALWSRLRNKQLLEVQFYRQKPIGGYIVDFYAPGAKLVVEVDGSQHMEGDQCQKDGSRDEYLASIGLKVLRFNSREVLRESDSVVGVIYRAMTESGNAEIPPNPPLVKGGEVMGIEKRGIYEPSQNRIDIVIRKSPLPAPRLRQASLAPLYQRGVIPPFFKGGRGGI